MFRNLLILNLVLALISLIIISISHFMKYRRSNDNIKILNEKINDKDFLKVYNKISSGYITKYKDVNTIYVTLLSIILDINICILTKSFPIVMTLIIFEYIFILIYKDNKENKLNKNNNNRCEYHIIEKLGKIFYSSFKEDNSDYMYRNAITAYNNSKICNLYYDDFNIKDCFNFKLNNDVNVNIYNIITKSFKENDNLSNSDSYYTIFSGILAEVNLDFNINGFIQITRDYTINLDNSDKEKIKLDNSSFEKNFDVISSDEIKAVMFLTSDIMNRLNDLFSKYELQFEISIIDSQMYVTFNEYILNSSNPLKAPELEETYDNYCKLKHLFDIINLLYNKLKEFNLK